MTTIKLVFAELAVVAAGVATILGGYLWVLPNVFHAYKTYSVLIAGLALVAGASSLIAYQAATEVHVSRWLFVVGVCGCATAATLVIAMLVILNTVGS